MTTPIKPEPDPAVAEDAGQFIHVSLMDHLEQCSEGSCGQDTRLLIVTHEDKQLPYCNACAHVCFAIWMVGA